MVHRRTPFFPPHITEQRQAGAAGSGATLTWVRFPPWTLSSALGWCARISTPALTAEGKMTAGMCTYEVSALSFDESTIWGVSSPSAASTSSRASMSVAFAERPPRMLPLVLESSVNDSSTLLILAPTEMPRLRERAESSAMCGSAGGFRSMTTSVVSSRGPLVDLTDLRNRRFAQRSALRCRPSLTTSSPPMVSQSPSEATTRRPPVQGERAVAKKLGSHGMKLLSSACPHTSQSPIERLQHIPPGHTLSGPFGPPLGPTCICATRSPPAAFTRVDSASSGTVKLCSSVTWTTPTAGQCKNRASLLLSLVAAIERSINVEKCPLARVSVTAVFGRTPREDLSRTIWSSMLLAEPPSTLFASRSSSLLPFPVLSLSPSYSRPPSTIARGEGGGVPGRSGQ
mmetsp:Transcript_1758/g.6994  ORF Transcript_1758/g.6994 Transcript_1758/m.6994 type:complete len:400 (+) Transcript_1758:79-1278(+)